MRAERLSVFDRRAGHRRKPRVDLRRRGVHCHRRRLAQLDELFQIKKWGEDSEARLRREGIRDVLATATAFMSLSRKGP